MPAVNSIDSISGEVKNTAIIIAVKVLTVLSTKKKAMYYLFASIHWCLTVRRLPYNALAAARKQLRLQSFQRMLIFFFGPFPDRRQQELYST